ncbi:MAG TPA: hypothetical protein DHM90_11595 [Clostridiaceae bacterium]|nr:hypothetical protein [Clostridiaceae bacterium]
MINLLPKISLFTLIVGLIAYLSIQPFGLPVLLAVAQIMFLTAFVSIAFYALHHIIKATLGYSLFVKSFISTISVGIVLLIAHQFYPEDWLKMSMLISFGLTLITIIFKIFELIFLRKY